MKWPTIRQTLLGLTLAFLLSSCLYKAPDEDHLHEIPTTNNPTITRDSNKIGMPV